MGERSNRPTNQTLYDEDFEPETPPYNGNGLEDEGVHPVTAMESPATSPRGNTYSDPALSPAVEAHSMAGLGAEAETTGKSPGSRPSSGHQPAHGAASRSSTRNGDAGEQDQSYTTSTSQPSLPPQPTSSRSQLEPPYDGTSPQRQTAIQKARATIPPYGMASISAVLAGGGAHPSERFSAVFRNFDTDNDNALDHRSMLGAFEELNLVNGLSMRQLAEVAGMAPDWASRPRGFLCHEFITYCDRLAWFHAKQAREERLRTGTRSPARGQGGAVPRGAYRSEALRALYGRYSMAPGQGRLVTDEDYAEPRMTGSQFQRLVQDMGLMQPNGPITSAALGVLFASRKGAGHRRLGYPQFLKALGALAEESGADLWGAAAELQARYRQQQREAREQQQAQLLSHLQQGEHGYGSDDLTFHSDPEAAGGSPGLLPPLSGGHGASGPLPSSASRFMGARSGKAGDRKQHQLLSTSSLGDHRGGNPLAASFPAPRKAGRTLTDQGLGALAAGAAGGQPLPPRPAFATPPSGEMSTLSERNLSPARKNTFPFVAGPPGFGFANGVSSSGIGDTALQQLLARLAALEQELQEHKSTTQQQLSDTSAALAKQQEQELRAAQAAADAARAAVAATGTAQHALDGVAAARKAADEAAAAAAANAAVIAELQGRLAAADEGGASGAGQLKVLGLGADGQMADGGPLAEAVSRRVAEGTKGLEERMADMQAKMEQLEAALVAATESAAAAAAAAGSGCAGECGGAATKDGLAALDARVAEVERRCGESDARVEEVAKAQEEQHRAVQECRTEAAAAKAAAASASATAAAAAAAASAAAASGTGAEADPAFAAAAAAAAESVSERIAAVEARVGALESAGLVERVQACEEAVASSVSQPALEQQGQEMQRLAAMVEELKQLQQEAVAGAAVGSGAEADSRAAAMGKVMEHLAAADEELVATQATLQELSGKVAALEEAHRASEQQVAQLQQQLATSAGAGGGSGAGADGAAQSEAVARLQQQMQELNDQLTTALEQSEEAHAMAAGAIKAAGDGTRRGSRPGGASRTGEVVGGDVSGGDVGELEARVAEVERRLRDGMEGTLREVREQGHEVEELRRRLEVLDEAHGDTATAAAAAAAAQVQFTPLRDHQEFEMYAGQNIDTLHKEVRRLTTITNDLLGDMQEAANDVGKMTVTIKQLQAKTDELAVETAALRRPPAPGADPNSAMARARQSHPGAQQQGHAPPMPPQQQRQHQGGGGEEAVPSGALARVEDEARQRDIELDDAIQGLAERLTESEKLNRNRMEHQQNLIIKLARQVDAVQRIVADQAEGGTANVLLNRPSSPNTMSRIASMRLTGVSSAALGSRSVSYNGAPPSGPYAMSGQGSNPATSSGHLMHGPAPPYAPPSRSETAPSFGLEAQSSRMHA